jgi:hypothetical protein
VTPPGNPLHRLSKVSPTVAFLVALALMLAGLFAPGIIGAAMLFLLAVGLATLTFSTWPVQTPATRGVRVVLLVLLLGAVVAKAL